MMQTLWATGNLTLSSMFVVLFVLWYSRITLGRCGKLPKILLAVYMFLLHTAFYIVSSLRYGDVLYLLLKKDRVFYSVLCWTAFTIFYLAAYRKQPLMKLLFHALVNFATMSFSDILAVIIMSVFDAIAGTSYCHLFLEDERWRHWYCVFGYVLTLAIYSTFLILLKKRMQRRKNHPVSDEGTRKFPLFIFPAAQVAASFTYTIIVQKYKTITDSPFILMLILISFALGLISTVILIRFLQKLYAKEQLEQKLRYYEQYEALSLQYQEQAASVSREAAKMRHDFNNQMQVLSGLIAAGAIEDAKEFAAELHHKIQAQSLQLQYCENKIANTILQQMAESCAAQHVRFDADCSLSEDLPISKLDLCSLLLNPLQHAEEAVQSAPEKERSISCSIHQYPDTLQLCIRSRKGVQFCSEAGLDIPARIAKNYRGKVDTSVSDAFFTISIRIPLSEKETVCSTTA